MDGLVDEEIKEDVLASEEKTLKKTAKTVEAIESTKRVVQPCLWRLIVYPSCVFLRSHL